MTHQQSPLPPVVRSVTVPWDQHAAFERFTLKFAEWWPYRSHSIGEKRVKRIVFEPRVGGVIFEEHHNGRRFQWGEIVEWSPPTLVRFTWHPSRDAATAQDVAVRFEPVADGTQVTLTASNWERWGEGATRARQMYDMGWGYVLNIWAGRRTPRMMLLGTVARVMGTVAKLRGGGLDALIAKAGGEIQSQPLEATKDKDGGHERTQGAQR